MLWRGSLLAATIALAAVITVITVEAAHAEKVDLELVLAVDVSGSIDPVEARLQRTGYLQALTHPEVIKAITSGYHRKVAVTYVEWAGGHYQEVVVDWSVLRDATTARRFAEKIGESPIMVERWTSISGAIDFALKRFDASPHAGERQVIDISGDGPNNSGGLLAEARARALKRGITINGLPIVNDRPQPFGLPPPKNLDKYYARHVIGGPGAFLIIARGFSDFGRAVKTKLVREISGAGGPRIMRAETPFRIIWR